MGTPHRVFGAAFECYGSSREGIIIRVYMDSLAERVRTDDSFDGCVPAVLSCFFLSPSVAALIFLSIAEEVEAPLVAIKLGNKSGRGSSDPSTCVWIFRGTQPADQSATRPVDHGAAVLHNHFFAVVLS